MNPGLAVGISTWVEKTTAGKELWVEARETLNIGDLFGYEENPELKGFLREEGIHGWRVEYELDDSEQISYAEFLGLVFLRCGSHDKDLPEPNAAQKERGTSIPKELGMPYGQETHKNT